MKTILLGAFLLAHGLLHASYLTPKPNDSRYPFDFEKGWLADMIGHVAVPIGTVLAGVVVVVFLLAALAVFGLPGLAGYGQVLVIFGAGLSLLLLALFWHPWLVLGMLIDVILLIGAYKVRMEIRRLIVWNVGVR